MKTISQIICAIVIFSAQNFLFAQPEAEQKAWMEYMTPGSIHDMIARSDGTWSADITMWMDPAAPPTKSTGTVTNKMILGGRYQQSTHSATFMGMPFEGISILGYDNAKKMFVNSWVDNMGTGILITEGPWNEATKTVTLTGKQVDPMTGRELDVREIFKIIDDNTQSFEMYMTKDGKEMKTMEIMYTRK